MRKQHAVSPDKGNKEQSNSQFIGALVIGAFVGVFVGLLAMALAILVVGLLRLFLPELTFMMAGMSITAVIFVVFFGLGWCSATIIIWHKLPPISKD